MLGMRGMWCQVDKVNDGLVGVICRSREVKSLETESVRRDVESKNE